MTKRNLSITNSYEEWYRIALAIANTFTYEIGEKYFLKISKIDDGLKFCYNICTVTNFSISKKLTVTLNRKFDRGPKNETCILNSVGKWKPRKTARYPPPD